MKDPMKYMNLGGAEKPSPTSFSKKKEDYSAPEADEFSVRMEKNFCGTNEFQGSKNENFSGENDFVWGEE